MMFLAERDGLIVGDRRVGNVLHHRVSQSDGEERSDQK
jgi:hypothetical protein